MHETAVETTQLRHADLDSARVGLLGVGLMGSAMAGRRLDQGIAVIAWDRDADHVRAIESRGGEAAREPREVVSGAGVVITMLPTRQHPRSG